MTLAATAVMVQGLPITVSATVAMAWGCGALLGAKRRMWRVALSTAHVPQREIALALDPSWNGALWGGLIAALLAALILTPDELMPWADGVACATALAYAVAKVGCYGNGCCDLPANSDAMFAKIGISLPLAEVTVGAAILCVLVDIRSYSKPGVCFVAFMVLHGAQNLISHHVRENLLGHKLGSVTTLVNFCPLAVGILGGALQIHS